MEEKVIDINSLEDISKSIRTKVVNMIYGSGVGHLGGAMSIVDILNVLYFNEMKLNPKNPLWENRDRLILSKGHGCPALYAALAEKGFIDEDVLCTLHKIDSPLQMHPEFGRCPGIDMSAGSLGQGISAAIGMAIGARIRGSNFRVYTIIGDGESAEGQIWEAAMAAPNHKLDNMVVILDYNGLALTDRISNVMQLEPVADKWRAFGWHVIEVNGHSIPELLDAFKEARGVKGKPSFIIAHTIKGYGASYIADRAECHSVSLTREQADQVLKEICEM